MLRVHRVRKSQKSREHNGESLSQSTECPRLSIDRNVHIDGILGREMRAVLLDMRKRSMLYKSHRLS